MAPNRTGDVGGHVGMLQFSALVAGSVSLGARVANLIDPAAITALRFVLAGGNHRRHLRDRWAWPEPARFSRILAPSSLPGVIVTLIALILLRRDEA
ncbi:hypothetical protein [Paracoccus homiensis]|nr:hypothetical protein [Paracoccus homiensis]